MIRLLFGYVEAGLAQYHGGAAGGIVLKPDGEGRELAAYGIVGALLFE